jgi:putative addiction module component (TIGR02574 family)
MADYESLLSDACELPVEQRVRLIEALWDTVPQDAAPPLSEEWLAEIQRRSAEFDAGGVETIPWETVRNESLRRIGLKDR